MSTIAGTHSIVPSPPSEPAPIEVRPGSTVTLANSWYSAAQIKQRVQVIQQIFREVMQEGTHFGTVPGCDKPSLWKAGTEQLLMTFQLACRPEVLDLSNSDCARFRVTCHITSATSGQYLGSGIGEASSDETKYKWRKASWAEYENTAADRRKIKYGERRDGSEYQIPQVRQEVADVANTVLKMAKKRAQVDATLTVTAASDIFTQDLEDMENPIDNDTRGDSPEAEQTAKAAEPARPVVQMPTRRQPAQSAPAPRNTPPSSAAQSRPTSQPPLQPRTYSEPPRRPEPQRHSAPPSQPARRPAGDNPISEAQDKRFFAIAMNNGITKQEITRYLEQNFGISHTRDIQKGAMYDQCCAWAEGQ